jgi:hypothetical protein
MHQNKTETITKGDKVRCYESRKSLNYGEGIVLDDNYTMNGRRHYRVQVFNTLKDGVTSEVEKDCKEYWYVIANGYWTIRGRTHQVRHLQEKN